MLERVTESAFGQRRKMLRQSLRAVAPDPLPALEIAGIAPTARAEEISVEGFVALANALSNGAANVSVNLIQPNTLYSDRRNNLDFRVSKILQFGRTRTQVGLDIYNVTNTDVVTGFNQTFVPNGSWLTPTSIQPARYVRANVQIDF